MVMKKAGELSKDLILKQLEYNALEEEETSSEASGSMVTPESSDQVRLCPNPSFVYK